MIKEPHNYGQLYALPADSIRKFSPCPIRRAAGAGSYRATYWPAADVAAVGKGSSDDKPACRLPRKLSFCGFWSRG